MNIRSLAVLGIAIAAHVLAALNGAALAQSQGRAQMAAKPGPLVHTF